MSIRLCSSQQYFTTSHYSTVVVWVTSLCLDTLVKPHIEKMRLLFMIQLWLTKTSSSTTPVSSVQFLPSPVLRTPTTLLFAVAVVVARGWQTYLPLRWPRRISDHLLGVVWQSSLSLVSLESPCTCAFFTAVKLFQSVLEITGPWSVFLVMCGRVLSLYLTCDSAVGSRRSTIACFHPPEMQTFVVARVASTAVSSSARVVLCLQRTCCQINQNLS